jgi:hypothetical protein
MSPLRLPQQILDSTFQQLRDCGAGHAECVVYWCASLDEPSTLARVVHPVHHASRAGYEVDSAWVTQFFLELRRTGEAVRVQVHTHPREAGHSGIDDHFSLVPASGFLSLVIPDFAVGPVMLAGTALVQMQADGNWAPADPEEAFCVE